MPLGIPISQLIRETLIDKAGYPYAEAQQVAEEIDAQLLSSDWIELLDGTTFTKKSPLVAEQFLDTIAFKGHKVWTLIRWKESKKLSTLEGALVLKKDVGYALGGYAKDFTPYTIAFSVEDVVDIAYNHKEGLSMFVLLAESEREKAVG